MTESPKEAWARSVVENYLGVELTFADAFGGVDYLFTNPASYSAAMEVTTLTDQKLKGSVAAYADTRNAAAPPTMLQTCWTVGVHERDAKFRDLEARLEPLLAALESAGVGRGTWWPLRDLRFNYPDASVEAAVAGLTREKVDLVMRWPAGTCTASPVEDGATTKTGSEVENGPHAHLLQVSTMGDFVEVGPDVALVVIENFVHAHSDNLRKLARSEAQVKHLFVCLDEESSASVSHSVSRRFAPPNDEGEDQSGLPDRPPALPAEVNELWVVYQSEGAGWHWGKDRWERIVSAPGPW